MTAVLDKDARKWGVLAGLFLIYMASNGITLHTLPLLYPELIESFGWRAAEVTLPATVFFIVGAFTSPPAGWLLDRYSPRLIIVIGSLSLCCGLMAYARVQTLWQITVIYALLGLSLSLCGLVSNMVVLTGWFRERRGRATGILLMASSVGGALFPIVVGAGLAALGWRQTMLFAGIATGAVMLGSGLLLLRDSAVTVPKPGDRGTAGSGPQLSEALRQPTFYKVLFATGSVWFVIIALTQHQSIYLAQDVGLPRVLIPGVFSVFFASSVAGKLGFGLLSDRFDLRRVMTISIVLLALSLLALTQLESSARVLLYGYAAVAGLGFSGSFTCIQLLVARYFQGPAYGRILAVVILVDTLCGALGTRAIGLLREQQGDYLSSFLAMAVLAVLAAVVVSRLGSGTPSFAPAAPSPKTT